MHVSKGLARLSYSFFLMLLFTGLFSTCVPAQTRDLSAITGQVLDPQNKAVVGAEVTLTNPAIGLTRSVKTDGSGNYSFSGLSITSGYGVKVQYTGFTPAEHQNIVLVAGQAAVVNLTLSVSAQATQVTVYGTPGSLIVDSDQVVTRLDTQKIESTPIINRKVTSLPLLDSAVRAVANYRRSVHQRNLVRH